MRNPNGLSIEEKEVMAEQLEDLNEAWRNQECFMCGLARKIVVHSDTALEEHHPFVAGPSGLPTLDEEQAEIRREIRRTPDSAAE